MRTPIWRAALFGLPLAPAFLTMALAAQPNPGGTVEEAVCPLVESAARDNHIGVGLLTRLVWTESRFQAHAVSPKGAQGIAQFMPQTAAQRGLNDPFDPEQAIPKAAGLLAEYAGQFGNIGLAAAAYSAGPNRITDWLAGSSSLPGETAVYVMLVTGRGVEDWARDRQSSTAEAATDEAQSCTEITAALRTAGDTIEAPVAPWGVQLAGNFSKAIALASFARAQRRYQAILGDLQPMIVGSVLRSRGSRRFYRIMIPEGSRADADRACRAIVAIGGACVASRS
ncbi:MAG TPA: lytic transglycosylase domain-containing protein [Stellaceae bacterium]|nr:lytic transglycosylase domain-containing protein [Stellaceae bacterium]